TRPEIADKAIADGIIDFWEMCRPLIADPYLPTKLNEGRPDDIVTCIADCNCLDSLLSELPVSCILNPRAGREEEPSLQSRPASKKRKVIVVGGGPAGMEAASTAAGRGHQVILYEQTDRLGGQLNPASVAPYKGDVRYLIDYLTTRISKSSVEVRLNTPATAQSIEREQPDVVILATGSQPVIPDIPGINGENVVTAVDVLNDKQPVGKSAVIIGGGMVGCEVAEFLVQKGKKVTILEMQKRIGQGINAINRWRSIQRLNQAGVSIETMIQPEEITGSGVTANREGKSYSFPADTVVLATGMAPARELLSELEGKVPVHTIGDCLEPRQIGEAMEEGFRLGNSI
ncbi:MAG: FAD-dependent oxidoreductase, partial [Chloroflexi bacterium]|nr:FAD-dependent oxidoreductase [Chloroflexota bacterium]